MASPFLKASPSGEAAVRRRLMRAEFVRMLFYGKIPQTFPSSVRGRGRGHLPPMGKASRPMNFLHLLENIPVSWYSKVFP